MEYNSGTLMQDVGILTHILTAPWSVILILLPITTQWGTGENLGKAD